MVIHALAFAAMLPVLAALAPLPAQPETAAERVGEAYPLNTCAVSGEAFEEGDTPIMKVVDGREVKFCCDNCVEKYQADPARFNTKLDAAIIEAQRLHYPVDTCIIGGGKLGGMGTPVEIVYNNRLVRFCCAMCEPKFRKDPAAALAKLDAQIIEAQREAYPLNECLISGEAFGADAAEPIDFVVANRLFRVCCNDCKQDVTDNPAEYLAQLDKAYADAQRDSYPMTTCAVRGGELGSMGEPVEIVAGNTLIKLCCAGCIDKVKADPAKFTAMVHAAAD
ncbi:MAG: YHS domain-containing protein [Phycisphaerales bacterium]|jgi:YHS domain-containing protein